MRTYQESAEMHITDKLGKSIEEKKESPYISVGLENQLGIETVIPDIRDDYKNKIIVQDNIFYYYYTKQYGNKQEVQWCFEAGIPVWGYGNYEDFLYDIEYAPITQGEYAEVDGVFVCAPDLTGFNPTTTYYVLFDENYTESIGNSLKVGAPDNITDWYNYSKTNKRWANILTKKSTANDGDNLAYFVWIPRYIYKLNEDTQDVDVRFVDKNNLYKYKENGEIKQIQYTLSSLETGIMQVNGEDTEYKLPEAFWWDNNNDGVLDNNEILPGYWVSKYEVSNAMIYGNRTIDDCMFKVTSTSIMLSKLKNSETTGTSTIGIASYDIYIDDELDINIENSSQNAEFNYTSTKVLEPGKSYKVKIVAKSAGGYAFDTYEETIVTKETNIAEITKPNLTGFNGFGDEEAKDENENYTLSNTYYVTYDSTGANETIQKDIPIKVDSNGYPINIPTGEDVVWYDYENKMWANIVTIGGDGDPDDSSNSRAYFTWIPRYEYKLWNTWQEVEIRFIPISKTSASDGYQIPEAFWWDNDNDDEVDTGEVMPGYWVSKYEVSDIN